MPRPRDTQRQRLYDSQYAYTQRSDAARRILDGATPLSTGAVPIPACQDYVDDLTSRAWFIRRWGKRHIPVGHKAYGNATWDGYDISLPPWARDEATILHEVAHALTPRVYAAHGPEFAGVLLTLVRHRIGADAARLLRESFRKPPRVRVSLRAVPEPSEDRLVTVRSAETVQRARVAAAASRPLSSTEAEQAAALLRRAVTAGTFGPPGRKPRAHALAVARTLTTRPKP